MRTVCWARAGGPAAAIIKAITRPLFMEASIERLSGIYRVLHQRPRRRAVVEALAASGAFFRLDLVKVARLQEFRPDRRFRADLAAQPARIADRVIDPDFHRRAFTGSRRSG